MADDTTPEDMRAELTISKPDGTVVGTARFRLTNGQVFVEEDGKEVMAEGPVAKAMTAALGNFG